MKAIRHLTLLGPILLTVLTSATAQSARDPAKGVAWLSFEQSLQTASRQNRPILVDIFAPWCGWCSRLQAEVYTDPRVQSILSDSFAVARLNIDAVDDQVRFRGYELSSAELAMGLGASGTPTIVFLNASGDYITRLPGFVGPDEFVDVLTFIASEAYRTGSFEEFLDSR